MEIPRYKICIMSSTFKKEFFKCKDGNICFYKDIEKLVEENKKLKEQLETINRLELGW